MSKEARDAALKAVEEKSARGPVGMIVYDPRGRDS